MSVTESERKALNRTSAILGLVLIAIGLIGIVSANGLGSPDLAVSLMVVSFVVAGVGGVFVFKGGEFGERYLTNKRTTLTDEDLVEDTVGDIVDDRRGIIWVWVVAIATWAIMAVAYFSLSMLVYMVLDSVESFYTFSEQELGVISLTRNVTGWFLIIMTIGIIGWALINSARREDQTYPTF